MTRVDGSRSAGRGTRNYEVGQKTKLSAWGRKEQNMLNHLSGGRVESSQAQFLAVLSLHRCEKLRAVCSYEGWSADNGVRGDCVARTPRKWQVKPQNTNMAHLRQTKRNSFRISPGRDQRPTEPPDGGREPGELRSARFFHRIEYLNQPHGRKRGGWWS